MKKSIVDELADVERVMIAEEELARSDVTPGPLPRWLRQVVLWATIVVVLTLVFVTFL